VQTPEALQESFVVQALPSLHAAPAVLRGWVHAPVALQTSLVRWLPSSGHGPEQHTPPAQMPLWHWLAVEHGAPGRPEV
jgi:hypothetical protein